MRPSQCQRLLDIEQSRTSWRYGLDARVWQLKWATALCVALYALSRYRLWRHPRPQAHVWIDGVLVEVLEEGWADWASGALLWAAAFFGALLTAFLLCVRPSPRERDARARGALGLSSAPHPAAYRGADRYGRLDSTSLRPARDAAAVPSGRERGAGGEIADGSLAAPRPLRQPRVDPTRPMRTSADLESFLQRASLELQRQQRETGGRQAAVGDAGSFLPGAPLGSRSLAGPVDGGPSGAEGAIHVRYHRSDGGPDEGTGAGLGGAPRGLAEHDWVALGVRDVDRALGRTREWVSELCRALTEEVDACDRWLAANGAEAYDCSHSLREVLQVSVAPAPAAARPFGSSSWGAPSMGAAPAPPQVEMMPKHAALLQQRSLIQRSDHRNFDTMLRLDQRVALEAKLDVTQTFPETATLSNAELSARQQYVLRRLRAFAKQRTLAAYRHCGGDAEGWREGFPCDAHLLLHVVRTCVEGMGTYVRFGYQSSGARVQDLAIYVGDTGEPYFYVRHRGHAQDRLYATRPGSSSLFEAILIFAALIHVHYGDVYGGVRGSMDLNKAGLVKVLREPKLSGGWAGAF